MNDLNSDLRIMLILRMKLTKKKISETMLSVAFAFDVTVIKKFSNWYLVPCISIFFLKWYPRLLIRKEST